MGYDEYEDVDAEEAKYRKEWWQKSAQDTYLLEAVAIEPDLLKVLELARRSRRVQGYNRVQRYYDLKEFVSVLVGFDGQRQELKTPQHFDAVMRAMELLLPEDLANNPDLSVYPGEDEVGQILATHPVVPREAGEPRFLTDDDLCNPDSIFNRRIREQVRLDRAWLANLKITIHSALATS